MKTKILFLVFSLVLGLSSCGSYGHIEKVKNAYKTADDVLKALSENDDIEIVNPFFYQPYTNILFVHVKEKGENVIYVVEGSDYNLDVVKVTGLSAEDKGVGEMKRIYKFNYCSSTGEESGRFFELWVRGKSVAIFTNHGRVMVEYEMK
ncbi:MAG: hypothetical protein PHE89_06410 [Alphaproteobacteria bacterium]|nr:hypothetical protein [Alphaproteobacteria bacterium]